MKQTKNIIHKYFHYRWLIHNKKWLPSLRLTWQRFAIAIAHTFVVAHNLAMWSTVPKNCKCFSSDSVPLWLLTIVLNWIHKSLNRWTHTVICWNFLAVIRATLNWCVQPSILPTAMDYPASKHTSWQRQQCWIRYPPYFCSCIRIHAYIGCMCQHSTFWPNALLQTQVTEIKCFIFPIDIHNLILFVCCYQIKFKAMYGNCVAYSPPNSSPTSTTQQMWVWHEEGAIALCF